MIQVLQRRYVSPSVILPKPEEPEQGKQNDILRQKEKKSPELHGCSGRSSFSSILRNFKNECLCQWLPPRHTYSPSLAELARFVAGCLPPSLEIYCLHDLSTHRTAFLLCSFVHFEIFWGKLICFLPSCLNYLKNQLMFLLVLSSQSCTGFGRSAQGPFSHELCQASECNFGDPKIFPRTHISCYSRKAYTVSLSFFLWNYCCRTQTWWYLFIPELGLK